MAKQKSETDQKVDYFMDVVLRNYCRVSEELDVVYGEIEAMQVVLTNLFRENADLRFLLKEAGIEAPLSDLVTAEELAEIQGIELLDK